MNLSGLWVGTMYNSTLNCDANVQMELRQVGPEVVGHMTVSHPLQRSDPVEGFVFADGLTLSAGTLFGSDNMLINATIRGNHIEGTCMSGGLIPQKWVISVDKVDKKD